MNSDFKDLLSCLNEKKVKYLVVGGYAVTYYAEPRYTKDLDLWVEASPQNSRRLVRALSDFGAPTDSLAPLDFATPGVLFIFGIPPNRVDILTEVSGVRFSVAWKAKKIVFVDRTKVNFVSRLHLKRMKKAAGRPQDLLDLKKL